MIALDFLPEMLDRTAQAAAEVGLANVEPLEGDMEASPSPDASVDHVISNGVITLAPRKACVLAECARRRGGAAGDPHPPRHLGRLSGRRLGGA